MGLLTFSINVTLDGCVDHQEGIADDETHAFFTRLMDEGGAMLWGRVTYEMMESYWPAVARGDEKAPPAMREWAVKLEVKPKYVVSSTRTDFPWTNSHHIAADLRTTLPKLNDPTPAAVLLGAGTAMVYPALLAAVGDRAHPTWRATSVGVYRTWRDLGYAIGALLAGLVAGALDLVWAVHAATAITLVAGVVAWRTMRETVPHRQARGPVGT